MGPKKGKKKKDALFMTDEERLAEEEARKKAEQERLEREKMLREMEEELRKAKILKKELEKKEMEDEKFMKSVLQKNCTEFRKFSEERFNILLEMRKKQEWETYSNCNHRPIPNDPPALNTFLYAWKLSQDKFDINNVLDEVEIIYETIQPTEQYIDLPLDMKKTTLQNIIEARVNYFEEIMHLIDKTSLKIIMDTKKYYERIDINQVEILRTSENFRIWMWGWAVGGRCQKLKEENRPNRKSPLLCVTLPNCLNISRYHLRVVHTSYDPYSIQCSTYHGPTFSGSSDLLEETKKIRQLEIDALKNRYANAYDEDLMPWWFLMDDEIVAEKKRKEQQKKGKKKKKGYGLSSQGPSQNSLPASKEKIEIEKETDEETLRDPSYHQPKTQILYSRSMTDLLEKREKECKGPEYYSEVDAIDFLEDSDLARIDPDSSIQKDNVLFNTERHTTFRSCLQIGITEIERAGDNLKMMNKAYYEKDDQGDNLSFTDKRVFLDWKSCRDISPDREAIRDQFEDFMFGDTETVLKDGKITYVKRNPSLRSIKDLFKDIVPRKSVGNLNMEPEVRQNLQDIMNTAVVSPTIVKATNIAEMKEMKEEMDHAIYLAFKNYIYIYINSLSHPFDPTTINLRQYVVIGGVYQFDFFEEEPQPYENVDNIITQLHYGEYKLKRYQFDKVPKIKINLSVEVERKMSEAKRKRSVRKASKMTSSSIEPPLGPEFVQTDDDLLWITVNLPSNIMYFECPTPVRWNDEKKTWSTDDTYDTKWNDQTKKLQFKLGKSGPFAMAVFRFPHLPYSNFHLKPSLDWKKNQSITLELRTRCFDITFLIKDDKVTILNMDHESRGVISHLILVPFTVLEMISAIRKCGFDLFPDWDSFLYINIQYKKLKPLEEHVYRSMGFASPAFEFSGSVYNSGSREDKIYFQMREMTEKVSTEPKFSTLLVEPRRAYYVTTNKKGRVKEDIENINIGYRPDLKSLVEKIATKKAERRMAKASRDTIATVIDLIMATKILSFT